MYALNNNSAPVEKMFEKKPKKIWKLLKSVFSLRCLSTLIHQNDNT